MRFVVIALLLVQLATVTLVSNFQNIDIPRVLPVGLGLKLRVGSQGSKLDDHKVNWLDTRNHFMTIFWGAQNQNHSNACTMQNAAHITFA